MCGCVNNRLAIGEGREVQRVERPENAVLVEIAAQGENGVQEEIALSCETETEVQTGVPGMLLLIGLQCHKIVLLCSNLRLMMLRGIHILTYFNFNVYRSRRSVFDRLERRRSPNRGRARFGGRFDARRRRPSLNRSPRRSPVRRSRSPGGRSPMRPRSLSADRKRIAVKRSMSPRDRQARSRSPIRKFRPRSWSMSSSGLSSSRSRSRSKTPAAKSPHSRTSRGKTPDSRGSTPRDYSPYNREPREIHDARDYAVKPAAKPRCRDYDEKGFCMRGDMCPYDHGADPVVVDDVSLPSVLQLNQGQSNMSQIPGQPPPPRSLAMMPQLIGPAGPVPARSMPVQGPLSTHPPPGVSGPLPTLQINLRQPPPPPPRPPGNENCIKSSKSKDEGRCQSYCRIDRFLC